MKSKENSPVSDMIRELTNLFLNYIVVKAKNSSIDTINSIDPVFKKQLNKVKVKTVKQLIDKKIEGLEKLGLSKTKAKKIIRELQKTVKNLEPVKKFDDKTLPSEKSKFIKKYPKLKQYTEHVIESFNIEDLEKRRYIKDFLALNILSVLISEKYFSYEDLVYLDKKQVEQLSKKIDIKSPVLEEYIKCFRSSIGITEEQPRALSKIQLYNRLLANGYHSRTDVINANWKALEMDLGCSSSQAEQIVMGAFNKNNIPLGILDFFTPRFKTNDINCCPPYENYLWQNKYDYYSKNSALNRLLSTIKENASEAFRGILNNLKSSGDYYLFEKYGIADIPDNEKDLTGLENTPDVDLLKPLILEGVNNMKSELQNLKDLMVINKIDVIIHTEDLPFADDLWETCGGIESEIHLDIIDINGHPLSIKPPDPVGPLGYDDGETAHLLKNIENLNLFSVEKVRLKYTSTNNWYFKDMAIRFRYIRNNKTNNLLYQGLPEYGADNIASWDLVVNDNDSGWMIYNEDYNYFFEGSNLRIVKNEINRLEGLLNYIEVVINTVTPDNALHFNSDNLEIHLEKAAEYFQKEEFSLARLEYNKILGLINKLFERDILKDYENEFLFAIYVLIADTYLEEGSYNFAYGYYVKSYQYMESSNSSYLWLKIASLFLEWGDSLYAKAGSDFEERLFAIKKYKKITDGELYLTWTDGCESEIKGFWIDIGTINGLTIAEINSWINSVSIMLYPINGSSTASIPLIIEQAEFVRIIEPGVPDDNKGFIRFKLDISEQGFMRKNFIVHELVIDSNELVVWTPNWIRFHIQFEIYNPIANRVENSLYGTDKNILVQANSWPSEGSFYMGEDKRIFVFYINYTSYVSNPLIPENSCEHTFLIESAQLHLDQITNHLNFLGINDEYVPSHRFQYLYQIARQQAERATQLESKYIQFKDHAENQSLSNMEVTNILELSGINIEIAQERVNQADLNLNAKGALVTAGISALNDANTIRDNFIDSYQPGALRFLNSVGISIPPGVSLSMGGMTSAITGMGYDEQFNLQLNQYESNVRQADSALHQARYNKSMAEVEVLIAKMGLELESRRAEFTKDKLQYLQNREMNETLWYQMASVYKNLLNTTVQLATKWAWTAERALEFETNTKVDIIRMDYFQGGGGNISRLGSEKLVSDLDSLYNSLMEFRERYRDIPNVIEREFYLSKDFHEQFRILTSSEPSPEMRPVANGLRRIQFTTPMDMYDKKIPGRYAFGRILGVEVEIQGDVGESTITGHLENAKHIMTENEKGEVKLNRRSLSLVRVPKPILDSKVVRCPPIENLVSDIPKLKANFPPFEVEYEPSLEKKDEMLITHQLEKLIAPIVHWTITNSGLSQYKIHYDALPKNQDPDSETKKLFDKAYEKNISENEIRMVCHLLIGSDMKQSISRINKYFSERGISIRFSNNHWEILKKIKSASYPFTQADYENTATKFLLKKPKKSWERLRYGWVSPSNNIEYKDLTPRYSDPTEKFDYIPDYINYKKPSSEYVLRVKYHEPDCLSLSTFNRKDDSIVFNPYNSKDLLGVFENCGIHMDWTLTLKAQTNDNRSARFVYDKIREVILRVWYHAAYERGEGPILSDLVENSVMQLNNLSLSISFYNDFYDEFVSLLGDFPEGDIDAMKEIRSYSDLSNPDSDGWIGFELNDNMIPYDDREISAIFLVIIASDTDQMPDYNWVLRKAENGPVFHGRSKGISLGELTIQMSQVPPEGFGGINPKGMWYFRLAEEDENIGKSLEFIRDIEMFIEYSVT